MSEVPKLNASSLKIVAYTDGACAPNPGPGGWGVVLQAFRGSKMIRESELCGGSPQTTNNQMELTAAIQALEALKRPTSITVTTDSEYLRNGITRWIAKWKRNGWLTASDKSVKNRELWQCLDAATAKHDVEWRWVKGHAESAGNNRADKLAQEGIKQYAAKPI